MVATISEYRLKMDKIFNHLGGKCVRCGSMCDLEIDHIDHLDKEFTISSSWGLSWDNLLPELSKCQLLCKSCHLAKSKEEGSLGKGWTNEVRWTHGTVWGYSKHKCRCMACSRAKSDAMAREYRKKRSIAQSG
ncbi:HNH endonuclease [Stenotrophomonas phage Marzo]|nr:HNH endonuclease [Stenotrophomonas phage Marzo]